jgi:hypothetical protein
LCKINKLDHVPLSFYREFIAKKKRVETNNMEYVGIIVLCVERGLAFVLAIILLAVIFIIQLTILLAIAKCAIEACFLVTEAGTYFAHKNNKAYHQRKREGEEITQCIGGVV